MWFNILIANHGSPGEGPIAQVAQYVQGTLGRNGHAVTIEFNNLYHDCVNLFLEYFPTRDYCDTLIKVHKERGYKIGVIATELMIDGTIPYANHGIHVADHGKLAEGGAKDRIIADRIAGYEHVARNLDFVWSFLERTYIDSKRLNPVTEFFPIGHIERAPEWTRKVTKDIDVLFFGTLTPHRRAVISSLFAQNIRVLCVGRGFDLGYLPPYLLRSMLDRAKIGLHLTLHARNETVGAIDPRFASCSRVVEMLERDVCVVSEEIPLDNPYRDFMNSAPPAEIAALCKQLLTDGSWQERAGAQGAAFRREMDVTSLNGPAIDRTLAAIGLA